MHEIFPDVYELLPSKQTPGKYRSFLIKQAGGNALVPCFSSSSTISAHFDAIQALGGLKYQLLGDSHFKTAYCDVVAERFHAPLYCSEGEAPDVRRVVKQVVTFPFHRHLLDAGIEVIPTPGHRPGGVCYRVSIRNKKYLFVGDFIWHDGKTWIPTPTKANVASYASSLRLLESIEFDGLLANCTIGNPVYAVEFDTEARKMFIADLLKQLNIS